MPRLQITHTFWFTWIFTFSWKIFRTAGRKNAHHKNFSKTFSAVQQNVPVFISIILQTTNEKIYECSWPIQAFKSITMIINTLQQMCLCEIQFLVSVMNKQYDDTPFYCPKERRKPRQDSHVWQLISSVVFHLLWSALTNI